MAFKMQLFDLNSINKYRLKIYEYGYADPGTDWHSNVVNPSYARLYFILESDGWYETQDGRFDLQAGQCYLLPSLFSFRCGCKTQMRQFFFHITLMDDNNQDVLPYITSPLSCPFSVAETEEFFLKMLDHELSSSENMMILSRLMDALSRLLATQDITFPEKNYSPCVSYALQYIHQHISARLTLEEVTNYSFASQTTLSKKFRQELGMTVGRYIENMVFAQAQCMLRDPSLSIADISEQLGFCDQFYFSSRFKRRYNESPQNYRKSAVI